MKYRPLSNFSLVFGLFGSLSALAAVQPSGGEIIAGNTPKFAVSANKMGAVDPSGVIDVTLWLNPHNKAELDSLAHQVTDVTSPNFRHFLSTAEFAARFAPTAAEAKTVHDFVTSHQLKLVRVGPSNFYVRAQGTVANVAAAFHVEINQYQLNGKIYRANDTEPSIEGPAATLVRAIYGLDDLGYQHPLISQKSLMSKMSNNNGVTSAASSAANSGNSFFTSTCFTNTSTQTLIGGGVTAVYKGNAYTGNGNPYGCGYTPAEIQAAYNLTGLYKEGFDGTGQTIVIVDWCGSPTITSDANAFSARFGLPALTKKNFEIINYPTPSVCAAPDAEINIDVEWAHAVAPGANIILLVPPTNSFNDIDEAVFLAASTGLGSVISNSYGSEEYYTPLNVLATESLISEIAAIQGVSNNYSTGDAGDFTDDAPLDNPASVSAPADSPYATGIGGVTLALNASNAIQFQAGWGNNANILDRQGLLADPPSTSGYFGGGSGGGPSGLFAKPLYQAKLSGPARLLPDISWLADPNTGGVIAISVPGVYPPLAYEVYGGTSLACPMFSALWAIANQVAGGPLGQAAPYLYSMPSSTITDILPVGSATNVTGKVTDSSGTTSYSAAALASPLEGNTTFYSATLDVPLYQDFVVLLSFGTDTGLTVNKGWDNVTGLGVPNAKAFADYFKIFN